MSHIFALESNTNDGLTSQMEMPQCSAAPTFLKFLRHFLWRSLLLFLSKFVLHLEKNPLQRCHPQVECCVLCDCSCRVTESIYSSLATYLYAKVAITVYLYSFAALHNTHWSVGSIIHHTDSHIHSRPSIKMLVSCRCNEQPDENVTRKMQACRVWVGQLWPLTLLRNAPVGA